MALGSTQGLIEMSTTDISWGFGQAVHMADNIANFVSRESRNYGSLNLLQSQGPLLNLYPYLYKNFRATLIQLLHLVRNIQHCNRKKQSNSCRLQLKCDGTPWRTGGEVKGKLANGVGNQYSSHYLGTWCIQHYYRWCAHIGCQQSTELTPPPI
jgi:hypothetical protein